MMLSSLLIACAALASPPSLHRCLDGMCSLLRPLQPNVTSSLPEPAGNSNSPVMDGPEIIREAPYLGLEDCLHLTEDIDRLRCMYPYYIDGVEYSGAPPFDSGWSDTEQRPGNGLREELDERPVFDGSYGTEYAGSRSYQNSVSPECDGKGTYCGLREGLQSLQTLHGYEYYGEPIRHGGISGNDDYARDPVRYHNTEPDVNVILTGLRDRAGPSPGLRGARGETYSDFDNSIQSKSTLNDARGEEERHYDHWW